MNRRLSIRNVNLLYLATFLVLLVELGLWRFDSWLAAVIN